MKFPKSLSSQRQVRFVGSGDCVLELRDEPSYEQGNPLAEGTNPLSSTLPNSCRFKLFRCSEYAVDAVWQDHKRIYTHLNSTRIPLHRQPRAISGDSCSTQIHFAAIDQPKNSLELVCAQREKVHSISQEVVVTRCSCPPFR